MIMTEICFKMTWGGREWRHRWNKIGHVDHCGRWGITRWGSLSDFLYFVCFISLKKTHLFPLTFKNSCNLNPIVYFSSFIVNFSSIQSHIQVIDEILSLSISFLKLLSLLKFFFVPGMFFPLSFTCWTPSSEPEFSLL